jgi:hypothetical protein
VIFWPFSNFGFFFSNLVVFLFYPNLQKNWHLRAIAGKIGQIVDQINFWPKLLKKKI